MKNIYKHYILVKILFLSMLLFGSIGASFFIYLLTNEIYPDVWAIAGPLLSLALLVNGLTGSKIKEINLHFSKQIIVIEKESLFSSKVKKIKFSNLRSELRTGNGKKKGLITKLRLVILDLDKEVEELNSNFLGFNNARLRQLHSDIKDIVKESSNL